MYLHELYFLTLKEWMQILILKNVCITRHVHAIVRI